MTIIIDRDLCTACESCVEVCPFGAMDIVDSVARANEACNLCGACEDACPTGAITVMKKQEQAAAGHQGIWVFVEQRGGCIAGVAYELLGEAGRLAKQLSTTVAAVLFGYNVGTKTTDLFAHGADTVYIADDPRLEGFTDDLYAGLLIELIQTYRPEIVLCGATCLGRSFFPCVAAALDTGLTADCTGLAIRPDDRLLLQTRPAFGGNIMATIICPSKRPQMATVRPKVMKAVGYQAGRRGELVQVDISAYRLTGRTRFIETVPEFIDQINLAEADIIVAGGRGLGSAAGFDLLKELAEKLGGAVGATRGAVDSDWISYAHQVGQTGKTVSPKLYLACGISGAVQHLVGMQSSDVIVAINNDPHAPIFDVADYGLAGDLYEIVPAIIQGL
jgi:electron transfer flavoprotein alpha subunit